MGRGSHASWGSGGPGAYDRLRQAAASPQSSFQAGYSWPEESHDLSEALENLVQGVDISSEISGSGKSGWELLLRSFQLNGISTTAELREHMQLEPWLATRNHIIATIVHELENLGVAPEVEKSEVDKVSGTLSRLLRRLAGDGFQPPFGPS